MYVRVAEICIEAFRVQLVAAVTCTTPEVSTFSIHLFTVFRRKLVLPSLMNLLVAVRSIAYPSIDQ
jgi:hypothetical protein